MKVECSAGCKKVYTIPDERLKKGKKMSFPCPACKAMIIIDLREESNDQSQETVNREPVDHAALKKKMLKSMKDLAPMPKVVSKAREVMANPNASFKEIGRILETDPAISARILKTANSAYYGLSGNVSSIQQASIVLGFETLGDIINIAGASKLLGKTLKGYRMMSGYLWRHSLAVAIGAKVIAQRFSPKLENECFSAGLLHDSGMLVMDGFVLQNRDKFEKVMQDGTTTFLEAEKVVFGFDHAEIAYELCTSWKIPESQTKAIKFHHLPVISDNHEMAYILYMADAMAKISGFGVDIGDLRHEINSDAMVFLNLDNDVINEMISEVTESVKRISKEI